MRLETILKTKIIEDPFRRVFLNVLYSGICLESFLSKHLRSKGITIQQFNVLRILNGSKTPLPVAAIQDRMMFKMSNVTRIVDKLYEKRLVSKSENAEDKRLLDVSINEAGIAFLLQISEATEKLETQAISKHLSAQEAEALCHLLDKLRG